MGKSTTVGSVEFERRRNTVRAALQSGLRC
jgi:hypothetical protein